MEYVRDEEEERKGKRFKRKRGRRIADGKELSESLTFWNGEKSRSFCSRANRYSDAMRSGLSHRRACNLYL